MYAIETHKEPSLLETGFNQFFLDARSFSKQLYANPKKTLALSFLLTLPGLVVKKPSLHSLFSVTLSAMTSYAVTKEVSKKNWAELTCKLKQVGITKPYHAFTAGVLSACCVGFAASLFTTPMMINGAGYLIAGTLCESAINLASQHASNETAKECIKILRKTNAVVFTALSMHDLLSKIHYPAIGGVLGSSFQLLENFVLSF